MQLEAEKEGWGGDRNSITWTVWKAAKLSYNQALHATPNHFDIRVIFTPYSILIQNNRYCQEAFITSIPETCNLWNRSRGLQFISEPGEKKKGYLEEAPIWGLYTHNQAIMLNACLPSQKKDALIIYFSFRKPKRKAKENNWTDHKLIR